jgi:glycosyltransferase involved in cell wall biosynthesis
MHRELAERGWKFEVWFMARSEAGRDWTFEDSEFSFPHSFVHGRHWRIGSQSLHLNIELLRRLRQHRPEILLVSGSWTTPTVWLAAMSSAPSRTMFWSESHLNSIQHDSTTVNLARRLVLSRFLEFAVPGSLSKKYVLQYKQKARIYDLPNCVDPTMFCDGSNQTEKPPRASLKQKQNFRKLLIVARLAPEKGLVPFFEGLLALSHNDRRRLTLLIAGSGPIRDELEQCIRACGVDADFVGYKTQAEISELYAQADGFCLPSLSDPNPLAVIEALWAGLPLLLSSKVGNHPECLQQAKNGFLFDPLSPESIAEAVSRWLELSDEQIRQFSDASSQIAHENFVPEHIIQKFLDQVLTPATPRSEFVRSIEPFPQDSEVITHSSSRP